MAVTFVFACLVILFNLIADVLYGWLDPRISLPLSGAGASSPGAGAASRRGARPGGASAAIGWRSRALVLLVLMVLAVALGPLLWQRRDQRHRLHRAPAGADAGTIRSAPTISARTCCARMLYGGRISLAVGLAAMLVAMIVGMHDRRDRRHLARQRRRRR